MVRGLLAAASSSSGSEVPRAAADAPMMALPCAAPLPGQEELGASLGNSQLPIVKKPKALVNKRESKIKMANDKITDVDVLIQEMTGYEQMCHGSIRPIKASCQTKASWCIIPCRFVLFSPSNLDITVSRPSAVKDAYAGELKGHVTGLQLKIQLLQKELDEGDSSKLQDSLDDLQQGITDYMQAEGGIKKLTVS